MLVQWECIVHEFTVEFENTVTPHTRAYLENPGPLPRKLDGLSKHWWALLLLDAIISTDKPPPQKNPKRSLNQRQIYERVISNHICGQSFANGISVNIDTPWNSKADYDKQYRYSNKRSKVYSVCFQQLLDCVGGDLGEFVTRSVQTVIATAQSLSTGGSNIQTFISQTHNSSPSNRSQRSGSEINFEACSSPLLFDDEVFTTNWEEDLNFTSSKFDDEDINLKLFDSDTNFIGNLPGKMAQECDDSDDFQFMHNKNELLFSIKCDEKSTCSDDSEPSCFTSSSSSSSSSSASCNRPRSHSGGNDSNDALHKRPRQGRDRAYWAQLQAHRSRGPWCAPGEVVGVFEDGVGPPLSSALTIAVCAAKPDTLGTLPEGKNASLFVALVTVGEVPVVLNAAVLRQFLQLQQNVFLCWHDQSNQVCIWDKKSLDNLKLFGLAKWGNCRLDKAGQLARFQGVLGVVVEVSPLTLNSAVSLEIKMLREAAKYQEEKTAELADLVKELYNMFAEKERRTDKPSVRQPVERLALSCAASAASERHRVRAGSNEDEDMTELAFELQNSYVDSLRAEARAGHLQQQQQRELSVAAVFQQLHDKESSVYVSEGSIHRDMPGEGEDDHANRPTPAKHNIAVTGAFPDQFDTHARWSCAHLEVLRLDHHDITGSLPAMTQCAGLRWLSLAHCCFTSPLVSTWGEHLQQLEILNLSHCSLTGEVPESLVVLQLLRKLDLSHNSLGGVIPDLLLSLPELEEVDLSDNRLRGGLPSLLVDKSQLTRVDFSKNELNGFVPSTWAAFQASTLRFLSLEYNQIWGPVWKSDDKLSTPTDAAVSKVSAQPPAPPPSPGPSPSHKITSSNFMKSLVRGVGISQVLSGDDQEFQKLYSNSVQITRQIKGIDGMLEPPPPSAAAISALSLAMQDLSLMDAAGPWATLYNQNYTLEGMWYQNVHNYHAEPQGLAHLSGQGVLHLTQSCIPRACQNFVSEIVGLGFAEEDVLAATRVVSAIGITREEFQDAVLDELISK